MEFVHTVFCQCGSCGESRAKLKLPSSPPRYELRCKQCDKVLGAAAEPLAVTLTCNGCLEVEKL